jgi:elongator complex protein 3
MDHFHQNQWQPYTKAQLLQLLTTILPIVPPYCRVTRIVRDFSSFDIVTGSKTSNLRQLVEKQLQRQKKPIQEIRFREIRRQSINLSALTLNIITYKTSIGQEKFLQFITPTNQIAAFLRLSLPKTKPFIKELSQAAIIREVHVYGQSLALGAKQPNQTQHLGLGKQLIHQAQLIASQHHYRYLSVISAIGTQQYYQKLGFHSGRLYQHLKLTTD